MVNAAGRTTQQILTSLEAAVASIFRDCSATEGELDRGESGCSGCGHFGQRVSSPLQLAQTELKSSLRLIEEQFNDIVASIGRRTPHTPGSRASILAALLGLAMGKMAIAVSDYDGNQFLDAILRLDDISERLAASAERDQHQSPLSAHAIVSFV